MPLLTIALIVLATGLVAQSTREMTDSALRRGEIALTDGRYTDARAAFETATQLDDASVNAWLGLGAALIGKPFDQIHPNRLPRIENAFLKVLEIQPGNHEALATLAAIEFLHAEVESQFDPDRPGHLDQSEAWNYRILEVNPTDRMALYSIGVIAWQKFRFADESARSKAKFKADDFGLLPDSKVRAEMRTQFGEIAQRGITSLSRAVDINPDFVEAILYLSKIHRTRAEWSEDEAGYRRETETADEWFRKVVEAKQRNPNARMVLIREGLLIMPESGTPPSRFLKVKIEEAAANLASRPEPRYPAEAKQARVEGVVRLSIIVDTDGHIEGVQPVSGHPLLIPAAIEAVRRSMYKPFSVNGKGAEVISEVEVKFTLPN